MVKSILIFLCPEVYSDKRICGSNVRLIEMRTSSKPLESNSASIDGNSIVSICLKILIRDVSEWIDKVKTLRLATRSYVVLAERTWITIVGKSGTWGKDSHRSDRISALKWFLKFNYSSLRCSPMLFSTLLCSQLLSAFLLQIYSHFVNTGAKTCLNPK